MLLSIIKRSDEMQEISDENNINYVRYATIKDGS